MSRRHVPQLDRTKHRSNASPDVHNSTEAPAATVQVPVGTTGKPYSGIASAQNGKLPHCNVGLCDLICNAIASYASIATKKWWKLCHPKSTESKKTHIAVTLWGLVFRDDSIWHQPSENGLQLLRGADGYVVGKGRCV